MVPSAVAGGDAVTLVRKLFASEAEARSQWDAINAALGLPRKDTHIGGGRHVDQDTPARLGWTVEGATITDGPDGVYLVFGGDLVARDGERPKGQAPLDLAGAVSHSIGVSERGATPLDVPPFKRRAADKTVPEVVAVAAEDVAR